MLKKNLLKRKLLSGEDVLGTWSLIPSPETLDVITSSGLDFVILDSEHGPLSFETAQRLIVTCENNGVTPLIRIGELDKIGILRALDIGAHGVQIPNIRTAEDVRFIVDAAKYPPIGERGFSPFTRSGRYSSDNSSKILQNANEEILIIGQIEDSLGLENIDAILKEKDLDVIFIGLYDLSLALGVPGEILSGLVQRSLHDLSKKITAAGKIAGTISKSIDEIVAYRKMGVRYIVHSVDSEMILKSYQRVVEGHRSAHK